MCNESLRQCDTVSVIELEPAVAYADALHEYLRTRGEAALYTASRVSQQFVELGIGPEDIVALHSEAFLRISGQLDFREQARAAADGMEFLLEAMIAFGVQYQQATEFQIREHSNRADTDRVRAEVAEKQVEEKGDLLDIVAHELRTPLTSVKGNLDLATRMVDQQRLDTPPMVLGRALRATDHLSRVMHDLLEAGNDVSPSLDRAEVDLREIGLQACDWCAPAAAEKRIEFKFNDEGTPVVVLGDAGALLRLVVNLLSNAIRYTPDGGKVAFRTYRAESTVVVEVQDTGIGIAEEEQERIFAKFYRSDGANIVDVRGLGLGLAIVQRIAKAHNGQVTVESKLGHGSTFRLILPQTHIRIGDVS